MTLFLKGFCHGAQDLSPRGARSCATGQKVLRLQVLTGKNGLFSLFVRTFLPVCPYLSPCLSVPFFRFANT
jgi:hypothetical protein